MEVWPASWAASSAAESRSRTVPDTTCTCQGWTLLPLGALPAISRSSSSTVRSMALGRKARVLLREVMAWWMAQGETSFTESFMGYIGAADLRNHQDTADGWSFRCRARASAIPATVYRLVASQVHCQPPAWFTTHATTGGPENWPRAEPCCSHPIVVVVVCDVGATLMAS